MCICIMHVFAHVSVSAHEHLCVHEGACICVKVNMFACEYAHMSEHVYLSV